MKFVLKVRERYCVRIAAYSSHRVGCPTVSYTLLLRPHLPHPTMWDTRCCDAAPSSYWAAKSRANSASERTGTPDGPFAIQGLLSSIQATPAMSRWIQGVSPTNSFRNIAAVTAPPQRPPLLTMSAMFDLIISRYSSSTGSRHIFSPEAFRAALKRL